MTAQITAKHLSGHSRFAEGKIVGSVDHALPASLRKSRPHIGIPPVLPWALLGLGFLVFAGWILARWLGGGGAHALPADGYQISAVDKMKSWVFLSLYIATSVACAAYVIRGCLKERKITFNAALFVGFVSSGWQRPLIDYAGLVAVDNRYIPNVATWGPYIPGWDAPHASEQGGVMGVFYGPTIIWVWLTKFVVDRVTSRHSRWRTHTLILLTLGVAIGAEILLEPLFLLTGQYGYILGPPELALFGDRYFQLPYSEVIPVAVFIITPLVTMIKIAENRGTEVFVLQGSDLLPSWSRPWARLLAGVGIANLTMLAYVAAFVACAYATRGGVPPADIPDYLLLHSWR
jgi:Spirocyclase AveC-like